MSILDYFLYVTHTFLLQIKKRAPDGIEDKAKNALTIPVFMISMLLFAIVYGIGISAKMISYSKPDVYMYGIVSYLFIRVWILRRYKRRYNEVITALNSQLSYGKKRVIVTFMVMWIVPIFLLWIGVILIRQMIYRC